MPDGSETVTVGATLANAWFDPAEHLLYLDPGNVIVRGDVAMVRGEARIVTEVETWQDGGIVAHLLPRPVYLPDLIKIFDETEADFIDPVTGQIPTVRVDVWPPDGTSGPALIEAEETATASDLDIMRQRNELVRYTVKTPLGAVNIQQGHRIEVTSSLDPRLENRILHVDRVMAGSYAQERIIMAVERQT